MRYYDRSGNPMPFEEWAQLFESPRHLGYTRIGRRITVSTVWLGLDHSFGHGPPLIFETMVFGGRHDQDMMRYASEEAAYQGHAAFVLKLSWHGLRRIRELPDPQKAEAPGEGPGAS